MLQSAFNYSAIFPLLYRVHRCWTYLEQERISVECKPPACREYGLHKIWKDVDILLWPWYDLHIDVWTWPY